MGDQSTDDCCDHVQPVYLAWGDDLLCALWEDPPKLGVALTEAALRFTQTDDTFMPLENAPRSISGLELAALAGCPPETWAQHVKLAVAWGSAAAGSSIQEALSQHANTQQEDLPHPSVPAASQAQDTKGANVAGTSSIGCSRRSGASSGSSGRGGGRGEEGNAMLQQSNSNQGQQDEQTSADTTSSSNHTSSVTSSHDDEDDDSSDNVRSSGSGSGQDDGRPQEISSAPESLLTAAAARPVTCRGEAEVRGMSRLKLALRKANLPWDKDAWQVLANERGKGWQCTYLCHGHRLGSRIQTAVQFIRGQQAIIQSVNARSPQARQRGNAGRGRASLQATRAGYSSKAMRGRMHGTGNSRESDSSSSSGSDGGSSDSDSDSDSSGTKETSSEHSSMDPDNAAETSTDDHRRCHSAPAHTTRRSKAQIREGSSLARKKRQRFQPDGTCVLTKADMTQQQAEADATQKLQQCIIEAGLPWQPEVWRVVAMPCKATIWRLYYYFRYASRVFQSRLQAVAAARQYYPTAAAGAAVPDTIGTPQSPSSNGQDAALRRADMTYDQVVADATQKLQQGIIAAGLPWKPEDWRVFAQPCKHLFWRIYYYFKFCSKQLQTKPAAVAAAQRFYAPPASDTINTHNGSAAAGDEAAVRARTRKRKRQRKQSLCGMSQDDLTDSEATISDEYEPGSTQNSDTTSGLSPGVQDEESGLEILASAEAVVKARSRLRKGITAAGVPWQAGDWQVTAYQEGDRWHALYRKKGRKGHPFKSVRKAVKLAVALHQQPQVQNDVFITPVQSIRQTRASGVRAEVLLQQHGVLQTDALTAAVDAPTAATAVQAEAAAARVDPCTVFDNDTLADARVPPPSKAFKKTLAEATTPREAVEIAMYRLEQDIVSAGLSWQPTDWQVSGRQGILQQHHWTFTYNFKPTGRTFKCKKDAISAAQWYHQQPRQSAAGAISHGTDPFLLDTYACIQSPKLSVRAAHMMPHGHPQAEDDTLPDRYQQRHATAAGACVSKFRKRRDHELTLQDGMHPPGAQTNKRARFVCQRVSDILQPPSSAPQTSTAGIGTVGVAGALPTPAAGAVSHDPADALPVFMTCKDGSQLAVLLVDATAVLLQQPNERNPQFLLCTAGSATELFTAGDIMVMAGYAKRDARWAQLMCVEHMEGRTLAQVFDEVDSTMMAGHAACAQQYSGSSLRVCSSAMASDLPHKGHTLNWAGHGVAARTLATRGTKHQPAAYDNLCGGEGSMLPKARGSNVAAMQGGEQLQTMSGMSLLPDLRSHMSGQLQQSVQAVAVMSVCKLLKQLGHPNAVQQLLQRAGCSSVQGLDFACAYARLQGAVASQDEGLSRLVLQTRFQLQL